MALDSSGPIPEPLLIHVPLLIHAPLLTCLSSHGKRPSLVFLAQGLSTELGAFVAGVMLSTTDQQEHALHQLEQVSTFACCRRVC